MAMLPRTQLPCLQLCMCAQTVLAAATAVDQKGEIHTFQNPETHEKEPSTTKQSAANNQQEVVRVHQNHKQDV